MNPTTIHQETENKPSLRNGTLSTLCVNPGSDISSYSYITQVHTWSQADMFFNLTHTVILFVCPCIQYFLLKLIASISQNTSKLVAFFKPCYTDQAFTNDVAALC